MRWLMIGVSTKSHTGRQAGQGGLDCLTAGHASHIHRIGITKPSAGALDRTDRKSAENGYFSNHRL